MCPISFCLGFGHAGLNIPAAERAHVQPWPVSLRAIGVSVRETPRAERALRCVVASPAPLLSWPRSPSALLTAFPTTPVCCIWFRRWQVYELQGSTRCSDALHCRHRLAFLLIRSHHILQLGHFLLEAADLDNRCLILVFPQVPLFFLLRPFRILPPTAIVLHLLTAALFPASRHLCVSWRGSMRGLRLRVGTG